MIQKCVLINEWFCNTKYLFQLSNIPLEIIKPWNVWFRIKLTLYKKKGVYIFMGNTVFIKLSLAHGQFCNNKHWSLKEVKIEII